MNLVNPLELDIELTEYINQHACVMNMQSSPIALFDEFSTILYANTALHHLLNTDESLPTLEQFNAFFRGIKQSVSSSIKENKSKILDKAVEDTTSNQLIPYKINIRPVTRAGKCMGAIVIVEPDVNRLVDYFVEEKSLLSNKISTLSEKLKNTFNLVNAMFDNSPVGMMILDNQNRIMQINKSGAGILDMKVSSLIGMYSNNFYIAECDNQLFVSGSNKEEVHAVTGIGKKKILIRCSVKSENKNEGEETFSVETFVDITEIEHARIAAEESNKVKSEFLANMSHELRTPLHAIIGFSQCGIEQAQQLKPEKASGFFQKINNGGEILLALVNNLLDLSKLETGKVDFDFEPIQLDKLVEEVVKEFEVLSEDKKISIHIEVKNKIDSLDMDGSRIQQVVRNIISNAVKFSKERSDINIIVEQLHDFVQLRVYDAGPGIPDDEVENVFDKFIQSSRTKTGAGGTGLGLSICREIVNQHGGVIWAENNPHGGAIFIVNLYLSDLMK